MDFSQVGEKPKAKLKTVLKLLDEPPAIEPIQKELEQYKPKLAELEKQAKDLKVIDQETFQVSIDGAGTAKGLVKAIEGQRAELTTPYREFINKVNNAAKFFTDPLKKVAQEFSRKSGDYQYQEELAEKKQQKLIEEANRKLQEDLDKQAKKDGVEAPVVVPVKVPKPATVIHTAGGHSQHLRKEWVGEIQDGVALITLLTVFRNDIQNGKLTTKSKIVTRINQILSLTGYYAFDQKLINQAVKMGIREIFGVKIYEKHTPVHK